MKCQAVAVLLAAVAVLTASALPAAAQKGSGSSYVPSSGQEGKNVIWLPTPQAVVDKMLDMAKLTKDDYVMDLGSGDGRTVITAARRGVHAMGIEYNPDMVALSRRNAEKEGVTALASFAKADLFETDFSRATVITMFLLPAINLKLRAKILLLKPGTRILSNTFTMGDWHADESFKVLRERGCDTSWCNSLLWIVPAQVSGTYLLPQGEFTLNQEYQMLTGTLRAGGRTVPVEGKVRGEEVTLSSGAQHFHGRMSGGHLKLAPG